MNYDLKTLCRLVLNKQDTLQTVIFLERGSRAPGESWGIVGENRIVNYTYKYLQILEVLGTQVHNSDSKMILSLLKLRV